MEEKQKVSSSCSNLISIIILKCYNCNYASTHNFVSNNRRLQCIGSRKGLTLASLNVNGLRNNLDEVKVLMNAMKIDILALNETKLDSSFNHDSTEIAGYNQQRLD